MIEDHKMLNILKGNLGLINSRQRRTNLEESPPEDWGSELVGEGMVATQWMVEEFAEFCRPKLVNSHQVIRK